LLLEIYRLFRQKTDIIQMCQCINQARNQEGAPAKFFAPLEKCVGHSLKNLGPSQKTLRPT